MHRRGFFKKLLTVSGASVLGFPAIAMAEKSAATSPEEAFYSYSSSSAPKTKHIGKIPPMPWGYAELDPEEVRKLGHLGYYAGECGAGAVWAIFYSLKKKVGYPYTALPIPDLDEVFDAVKNHRRIPLLFHYAAGGVEGYATLCGAANGSAFAIECAMGMEKAKGIIRRLYRWYEQEAFPSAESNKLAVEHKFLVPYYKYDKALPRVRSNSVLCHVQVSHWCKVAGFPSGSRERSERCARVAGDVASHAAVLMNAAINGKLNEYPFILDHDTASCRVCHYKGMEYEQGAFDRGFMDCASCHANDIRAHAKESNLKTAFGVNVDTWIEAATVGSVAAMGTHLVITNVRGKGKNNEDEEED